MSPIYLSRVSQKMRTAGGSASDSTRLLFSCDVNLVADTDCETMSVRIKTEAMNLAPNANLNVVLFHILLYKS